MFLFSCAYAYAYVACVMLIAQVGTCLCRLCYAYRTSGNQALAEQVGDAIKILE